MKLTSYKYRLPFISPLRTSKATITHREGIILEYTTPELRYYAEAAPLPGFSLETLDDVQYELDRDHQTFVSILAGEEPVYNLYKFFYAVDTPRSLQFALDSLAYQVTNHEAGFPQHHLFNEILHPIPVNGLVSLERDDVVQQVDKLIEEGFHTIKIKVGMNFDAEYQQLQKIDRNFPDVTLRLDANQSWSLNNGIRNLSKLEELNIEYCEEPLENVTPHNYETLANNTDIPLALDESLTHRSGWIDYFPAISYIVIKPMFLGCLIYSVGIREMVDDDIKIVVTTSLESAVGRKITSLMVASGAGSPDVAHGLHTGRYLSEDVMKDDPLISEGKYHPDTGPLWKNLHRSHLQKIATQIIEYS